MAQQTSEEFHLQMYLLHDHRLVNKHYDTDAEKQRLWDDMLYHMDEWLNYQVDKPLVVYD